MRAESEFNNLRVIEKIDPLRTQLDNLRPLPQEVLQKIMQKFKLDWNYHSNAIEGNSLDYGETRAFLMYGITAKGKPFKDYLDIKGHNAAIEFLIQMVNEEVDLTEKDIRALHEMVLVEPYLTKAVTTEGKETTKQIKIGQYKTSTNHVKTITGEIHYYASPEETPIKMQELMSWYREMKEENSTHPLIISSLFHHRFLAIHPFDDGNGRLARLILNLMLMQNGYPPVIIKNENRNSYYLALSQGDAGDYTPIIELIGEALLHSFDLYLKGIKGESLEEPEDLDKEIALFKVELEGRHDRIEAKRTLQIQEKIVEETFKPLLQKCETILSKYNEFYILNEIYVVEEDKEQGWYYTRFAHFTALYKWLQTYVTTTLEFQHIIIVVQFNEFKTGENHFGTEASIIITFEDYKYNISFNVAEADELLGKYEYLYPFFKGEEVINKYYPQNINESEVNILCNKLGRSLLSHMTLQYKSPDAFDLRVLNKGLLEASWRSFLQDRSIELARPIPFKQIEVKDTLIICEVNNDSEVQIYKQLMNEFVLFIMNKIGLKKHIPYTVYDNDLPF